MGLFWFWRIWKINSKRDWNHIVHNVYDTQTCHIFATNAWIFVKNSDFPDLKKSTFLAVFWRFWHLMTHWTMINDLPVKKGTHQKNIVKNSTHPPTARSVKKNQKKLKKKLKKLDLKWLTMHFEHNLFFLTTSPKFGFIHTFFLTGSLRKYVVKHKSVKLSCRML